MSNLKQKTASGIKWLVGASFLQKALSVGTMVILARILNPSIFGLFALAFVAIDGLGLFKSMGFDSALIQRKNNIEKAANTAFFIIPALGILLFLILNLAAPYIGKFLNTQEVIPVIRILGLVFVFSCLGNVPKALLQKEMHFAKVAFSETMAAVIYSVVAIFLALSGFGIWSLVIGYLAKTIIITIAVWYFSKWKPKWQFDKEIALQMFHFGKFIFLGAVVWFLKLNLDNLLVGKLLGVTALGIYALAFNISNFGSLYLGGKINRVIYPAYSQLQDNLYDLRRGFLKTLRYVSIFAFPFCLGLVLLGKEFVEFVYGQKWYQVSSILVILAWAGLFRTLPVGTGAIFLALGKPKINLGITSLQVGLFFILVWPAASFWGLKGVSLLVTFASAVGLVVAFFLVKRLLKLKISQFYRVLRPAAEASLIMTGIALLAKYIFAFSPTGRFDYSFVSKLLLASGGYLFFLALRERSILKEIKRLIFSA